MSEIKQTEPISYGKKMLAIFRKEGGDEYNCPPSITLEMLARATGAELKPRLSDAGIMVKNKNKSGLWYAYYKVTLSAMIYTEDHKDEPPINYSFGVKSHNSRTRKIANWDDQMKAVTSRSTRSAAKNNNGESKS